MIGLRPRALWWILSAACGGGSADTTIDIVHDVCAPIALAVDAPTEAQAAGIDGAIALWRAHGVESLRIVDGGAGGGLPAGEPGSAGGVIAMRFEPAAAPFYGLYDDEAGVVYINSEIEQLTALSIVIAHELGHAFGLPHVELAERDSLMNPGNRVIPPNDADQAAIEALWGRCGEASPEPR